MAETQDYIESEREREEGHVDTRSPNHECERPDPNLALTPIRTVPLLLTQRGPRDARKFVRDSRQGGQRRGHGQMKRRGATCFSAASGCARSCHRFGW